jgi:hypothetical protein
MTKIDNDSLKAALSAVLQCMGLTSIPDPAAWGSSKIDVLFPAGTFDARKCLACTARVAKGNGWIVTMEPPAATPAWTLADLLAWLKSHVDYGS